MVRKVFNTSSNAYLEVQWYLFAASFLLAAGYTLLQGEHVKIDVLSQPPVQARPDLGRRRRLLFFLIPMCCTILWFSIPFFLKGYRSGEVSSNAGGLIRWPVYAMMPLGFSLLLLQGVSGADQAHRLPARPDRGSDPEEGREDGGRGTGRGHPPAAERQGAQLNNQNKEPMKFFINNLAPIMFAGLIVFLLMGFPVAFSLGACGLFFGFIGVELGVLPESLLQALPLRIFGIMQNDTLLAIPFFTLMGLILERSGMAEDLLETIGQLFGPVRGGLAFAVIFVGALLAATTGVVAASVISMGLISLPIMLRYGYDRRIASGVIAASGTLAQIIPPSLVLIILADQLGRSVGEMYKGAFIPGFVLTGVYAGYVILMAIFKPKLGAGPAAGSAHHPRRQRQERPALAADADPPVHRPGLLLRRALRPDRDLVQRHAGRQRGDGRDHRRVHVRRRDAGLRHRGHQQGDAPGPAVAHGRTGHLRADPAAAADLPGAGHHLPGHRHADRRRRHGRHGRLHHGHGAQAPEP